MLAAKRMNEVVDSHPDSSKSLRRQKWILVVMMFVLSGLFGVLDSIYASTPGWERTSFLLDTVSFAFCLSVWCSCDAQLHGFRLNRGLRWAIILIALIGFPIYAFQSRGRRGWLLFGMGLLCFVLMMGVSVGLGWLTDVVRGEAG